VERLARNNKSIHVEENSNQNTRIKILETAKRLFLNNGYHNVSMRTLAKETGISTGPLYFHFQNKSEVFFSLSCEGLDQLNTRVRQAAALPLPNALRLREIFLAFEDFYSQEPAFSQIIRMSFNPLSGIDFTDQQREVLFAKKFEFMDAMKEVIRAGIENGELKKTDPTRFMLVLFALGEGIFTSNEMGDLKHYGVSVKELVQEASQITYTGIINRGDK
jgi:AcrR family transcriptional regulator